MTTASFKTRISSASLQHDALILACDYPLGTRSTKSKVQKTIKSVKDHICAIKINFHLLLSMNPMEIRSINATAHRFGIVSIADIKLNDIGNTNKVTLEGLHKMGFDAVIVNPIMGKKALASLTLQAHKTSMGVISLCHMSAPEAKEAYETLVGKNKRLYDLFLKWAAYANVDGIIVGATYPDIIKKCKKNLPRTAIYSPGVGVQGGNALESFSVGTKYVIVGRSIINSPDPVKAAKLVLGR